MSTISALADQLNAAPPGLILSLHSFTPKLASDLAQQRPWQVGVLWDKDEPSARRLIDGLRAVEGLVVGDNEPYSGKHPCDYTIDHHAETAGLPHLCIEVRQDQLESPAGTERWVRLLGRLIVDLVRDLESTWRRANLR